MNIAGMTAEKSYLNRRKRWVLQCVVLNLIQRPSSGTILQIHPSCRIFNCTLINVSGR